MIPHKFHSTMLIFWSLILTLIKIGHFASTPEPDEGYLDWCEEPENRKRVTINQCTAVSFVYPFPPCFCLKGAATLTVEGTETSKLIFSDDGCFNQKSEGTFNRTIKLERSVDRNKYLVAILNQDRVGYSFYEYKESHRNQVIFTNLSYYVYNGDVIDLLQEYKGIPVLCVQLTTDPDQKDMVKNYALTTFSDVYLVLNETCDGGSSLDDTDMISSTRLFSKENSQCVPTCPPLKNKGDQTSIMTRAAVPKSTQVVSTLDPMEYNMAKSCQEIPPSLRHLHQDLNRRIMTWAIERSFYTPIQKFSFKEFEPRRSFKILEKLIKITERYCQHTKIPAGFLHSTLEYFKIARQGRGFVFAEDFRESEYKTILKFLTRCLWNIKPLKMNTHGCPQSDIWVQSVYKPGSDSENFTILPTRHHQYFDHHVVLDFPWNMIDLANQVCVKTFSSSLRSYHIFEQGMERLFTGELRNFWLYPETQSFFYDRLFGSTWMSISRNIEKCIDSAYMFNGKMFRLNRPTWISSINPTWVSGVNRKKGTNMPPICTRKRTDIPLVSTTHEIYCHVQHNKPFHPVDTTNDTTTFLTWPDKNKIETTEDATKYLTWPDKDKIEESEERFLTWPSKPMLETGDDSFITWPDKEKLTTDERFLTWPNKEKVAKGEDSYLSWPGKEKMTTTLLTWPKKQSKITNDPHRHNRNTDNQGDDHIKPDVNQHFTPTKNSKLIVPLMSNSIDVETNSITAQKKSKNHNHLFLQGR